MLSYTICGRKLKRGPRFAVWGHTVRGDCQLTMKQSSQASLGAGMQVWNPFLGLLCLSDAQLLIQPCATAASCQHLSGVPSTCRSKVMRLKWKCRPSKSVNPMPP